MDDLVFLRKENELRFSSVLCLSSLLEEKGEYSACYGVNYEITGERLSHKKG